MTYFSDLHFLWRTHEGACRAWKSEGAPLCTLHFVPKGRFWWASQNEAPLLLCGPVVWWSAPGQRVLAQAVENECFERFSLGFEGPRALKMCESGLFRLDESVRFFAAPDAAEAWSATFRALWQQLDELPRTSARAVLLLEDLLLQLLESPPPTTFSPLEMAVAAWLETVKTAPQTGWNIENQARILGISSCHLRRVSRKLTGQTPYALITEARLERAALQLRGTDAPIKQIAQTCGFSEVGYFTRLFNARYRLPPARYRRAARLMATEIARLTRRSQLFKSLPGTI